LNNLIKILAAGAALLALALAAALYIRPWYCLWGTERLEASLSPTARVADLLPDSDAIFKTVEDLCAMGARLPGTSAGEKARRYVAQRLEKAGLEGITVIPSATDLWQCDSWDLKVEGEKISSHYMRHTMDSWRCGSFGTDGQEERQIVYVGEGREKDLRGIDLKDKIVLADVRFTEIPIALLKAASYCFYDPDGTFPLLSSRLNPYSPGAFPGSYYAALEHGAAGFVGILEGYMDSNAYNNEDYSWQGGDMKIPGLWVTQKDGEKIKGLIAQNGGAASASISMKGSKNRVEGAAIAGFLPGASDDIIMVHSHYDSVTKGAVEDASGTAEVLALAEFFAKVPRNERPKTLMFLLTDTHFSGYDTHEAVAERYAGGKRRVLADVCIEHIAKEADVKDGKLVLTGQVEPRAIFAEGPKEMIDIVKEEVVRHRLKRTMVLPATIFGEEVPTDADVFHENGVPIISLVSGPVYLYDDADTPDKVAKDELRPTARAFADIIWRLMDTDALQGAGKG